MTGPASDETVLAVRDLRVDLCVDGEEATPVTGVSLDLRRGECLGLVGESGCGKSMTLKALMGLLPPEARSQAELIHLAGAAGEAPRPYRPEAVRGRDVAMIFQEPMTALNPTRRVIDLIAEGPRVHLELSKAQARERALDLMCEVGIPDPRRRAAAWPWELSGGLRQRVMIAMALSCEPRLLLCDEPTTALDVSMQDQVLQLLDRLRRERGLAVLFVTHDLAVVRQIARRVAVMYAGEVVETGSVEDVFDRPAHPYTRALLNAAPIIDRPRGPLATIAGAPPDPRAFPCGCRFAPRCEQAREGCTREHPAFRDLGAGHEAACRRLDELIMLGEAAR